MNLIKFTMMLLILVPGMTVAQDSKFRKYQHSTSMDVITGNSYARGCYNAAGVAARIHYTSRKEIDQCDMALNYGAMSLRDRAATLTNRGLIYMALESYDEAIADYSNALKLKPEFGEIHVNIGNVYYLGKVFDKAIEEYTEAIELETTKIHIAHINRGMAYESLGDFDNAETDYRAAAALFPEAALPQVRLDQLLRKKEKQLEGIESS
ncbi:MAG: tetratricopeptide repeat protein [Gammaproteobacteria bacterium]|nr:tetratricopeptide repeat protein [Gammaproteobacteria bacterium]